MGIEPELKGEKSRKASWKMDLNHEAVVQHSAEKPAVHGVHVDAN